MRLYAGLQDKGFLRQLHLVGLVAQFESLLSTYSQYNHQSGLGGDLTSLCVCPTFRFHCLNLFEGEEIGMLEDMEVGIADLQRVLFQITEARTDDLNDLEPLVCGRR